MMNHDDDCKGSKTFVMIGRLKVLFCLVAPFIIGQKERALNHVLKNTEQQHFI